MTDEQQAGAAESADENTGESALDSATRRVREQQEMVVPHTLVEESPLPQSRRRIVVDVEEAEWTRRVEDLFKELQQTATVEGFRKGKAPMKLLQRRYLKDAQGDVVEKIVPAIIRQYQEEKNTTLYGAPAVSGFTAEVGKPVRITIEVEVKPEIEPSGYDGIEVEATDVKMPEDMVERRLKDLCEQNAAFEEVEREAGEKDSLVLDLKAVDPKGKTVDQQANRMYERPAGELPAEVAKELLGKKAGDTVEVRAPNPANASEMLNYTVSVKSVKELKLPDLDDDFAKDLGHDSAAAMRKSVEEDCRRMVESMKTDEAFDAIVKKLADAAEFEVPESLRESVQRDIMRSDLNFVYSTGVAPPRYRGKSRQEYREQVGVDAMSRVKGYLILDAIGKKENIEAAEEDINAALEERAREEGRKPVAIRAALEKRREWDHFVDQARFDKIRAFLLSKAKINWVEPKTPEASEEPKAE